METDPELDAAALRALVETFKGIVKAQAGHEFPQDPQEQLRFAIEAVFKSWNGERARVYRKMEKIPDDLGTAVNVQTMVFGNKGDDSGTGVAFTRDPATGENRPYGDFLRNAQGEDVVAGIRVTEPLDAMANTFPECHTQLLEVMGALQTHYRDMCDIEFTIEQGRLFLLQTRVGKRTAAAALRMAVEMEGEGLIDKREAVLRVQPEQLDQMLHPQFDPKAKYTALAKGLNASPGAAVGQVAFTADDAEARAAEGQPVILVRPETSPDDLHGMIAAEGILTSRGGLVSHAAVVARGMGTPAVCGASALDIDVATKQFRVGDTVVNENDVISINGTTGEIVVGAVPVITPEPSGPFDVILAWADGFRRLRVRTNADLPHDAHVARRFGAEGIGLCRTEHMFLGDRLPLIQRFILAEDEAAEHDALTELERLQRADFIGILEAMDGLPVTIRLLDPPLHEFLPDVEELLVRDALGELDDEGRRSAACGAAVARVEPDARDAWCAARRARSPSSIARRFARCFEAAVERKVAGGDPQVEVMIPLSVSEPELASCGRMGARDRRGDRLGDARDRRVQLLRRHHDRDPAGRARRRRDRSRCGVLLLRHERPHPDDVRLLSRRHRGSLHADLPGAEAARRQSRSRRSTAMGSGGWCAPPSSSVGGSVPTSSSGSAVSTAVIPRRWPSATRWASTTCRALPTACRSPAWPPPTRHWVTTSRGPARPPDPPWMRPSP